MGNEKGLTDRSRSKAYHGTPRRGGGGGGYAFSLTGAIAIANQYDNDTEVSWPEKTIRLGVVGAVAF